MLHYGGKRCSGETFQETSKGKNHLLDIETMISRSAKLERILAMVKELREEGERCLIFT